MDFGSAFAIHRTIMTRGLPQDRPIRVIRIIDRLNVGGPAKHVVWMTAALNEGGFKTALVTGTVSGGEGDMQYFADAVGVERLALRELGRELSWRDLIAFVKLLRLFFRLHPHIIHTHKAKAGAIGRVAAWFYRWFTPSSLWLRPRRCSVVHTYHGHIFKGYYPPAKTRLFVAIERVLARLTTDRIIALSEKQRDELVDRYRIGSSSQVRVIKLGVELSEFEARSSGLRAEFGIHPDTLLVGYVGRFCEVKNLPLLLEVAQAVLHQGVSAKFVLIGDGHLRGGLEARAHRLGLRDSVIFTGFRKDVPALYRDLDVVLLTSVNEGTPLTLIEAMAAGRAVASTEVGGVPDLMGRSYATDRGFTIWDHGVTAKSGDMSGLRNGIHYLLRNPAVRQRMGELGMAYVRDYHSVQPMTMDLKALYRELLET